MTAQHSLYSVIAMAFYAVRSSVSFALSFALRGQCFSVDAGYTNHRQRPSRLALPITLFNGVRHQIKSSHQSRMCDTSIRSVRWIYDMAFLWSTKNCSIRLERMTLVHLQRLPNTHTSSTQPRSRCQPQIYTWYRMRSPSEIAKV